MTYALVTQNMDEQALAAFDRALTGPDDRSRREDVKANRAALAQLSRVAALGKVGR